MADEPIEGIWDASDDEPAYPVPPARGPLAELLLSVLGLIALLMPLLLWIAWSQAILLTALAISVLAVAGCWLIVHFGPE